MKTKPTPQQHVKCIFRNGTLVEGIVESWSDEEVILLSLDRQSMLILPKPNDDIMLIKIVLSDNSEELKLNKPKLPKTELQQALDILVDKPTDTPGRIETLAELRIQLAEAEKAVITEKLQEHHVGTPNVTKYGSHILVGKKRPLTASAIQNLKGKK